MEMASVFELLALRSSFGLARVHLHNHASLVIGGWREATVGMKRAPCVRLFRPHLFTLPDLFTSVGHVAALVYCLAAHVGSARLAHLSLDRLP